MIPFRFGYDLVMDLSCFCHAFVMLLLCLYRANRKMLKDAGADIDLDGKEEEYR